MPTNYSASSDLPKMLHKLGNERIYSGAARHSPLLDSGVIPKKNTAGRDPVVNISSGGNGSTGIILDGANITHSGPEKIQRRVESAILYSGIKLGRKAVFQSQNKKETVNHLMTELDDSFEQLGSMLDGMMLQQTLATAAATVVAGGITTFTINEIFSLEAGQAIDILDADNSDAVILSGIVDNVAWGATPAGPHTVTLAASTTLAADLAVGDKVVNSGHTRATEDETFYSLSDLCDENVAVYGLAATGNPYNWVGQSTDLAGAALSVGSLNTAEAMRRKKSKKELGFSLCDSLVEQEYIKLREVNVQYPPSGSIDIQKYSNTTFRSKPVIVDENNLQSTWKLVGKDAVHLAEKRGFAIDGMGGQKPPSDLSAFRTPGEYSFEMEVSGDYQLYCNSRQAMAEITNIGLT